MSEQTDTDPFADAEPTNDNFVELRNAYKEASRELKELRAFKESAEPRLQKAAVRDAGFDPESPQASALLKLHDGDLDPEALKETASQYGLAPSSEGTPAPKAELTDEEQQAIASSERGQQMSATATPVDPQTMEARIAAAEEKAKETGDWSEWDQLQVKASLARS